MTIKKLEYTTAELHRVQAVEAINELIEGVSTENIDGIKNLPQVADNRKIYIVRGFYAGSFIGGGEFVYDASRNKADHNGGTVIATESIASWDGTSNDIAQILNWSGTGEGCYVRLFDCLHVEFFGAEPNDDTIDNALSINAGLVVSAQIGMDLLALGKRYSHSGITMPSFARLVGSGKYLTELFLLSGSNKPSINVSPDAIKFGIVGLHVKSNKAGNASGSDGIKLITSVDTSGPEAVRLFFSDLHLTDANGYNMNLESPTGTASLTGANIYNVTAYNASVDNYRFRRLSDALFDRLIAAGAGNYGFNLDNVANCKFRSCKSFYNKENGWSTSAGKRNQYDQCEAQEDFKIGLKMYQESLSHGAFICDANGRELTPGIGAEFYECSDSRFSITSTSFQLPTWQGTGVKLTANTDLYIDLVNDSVVTTPIQVVGTSNQVTVKTAEGVAGIFTGSSALNKLYTFKDGSGTFTPVLTFASAGTASITYSVQRGFFRVDGNTVTVQININGTLTKGTASGAATITGLPFPKLGSAPQAVAEAHVGGFGVGVTDCIGISCVVESTNNFVNIRASKLGTGPQTIQAANIADGAILISTTLVYRIS